MLTAAIKCLSVCFVFFVLACGELRAQNSFVYVFNDGQNTVSGYSVSSGGVLSPVPGSPFPTGGGDGGGGQIGVRAITVLRAANHLFVVNDEDLSISSFGIDPISGTLTPVSGSPFPTMTGLRSQSNLVATPDGRFLYQVFVASQSSLIAGYKIASNGALTPLDGYPISIGSSLGAQVSPDGRFLALAQWEENSIAVYRINQNGSLTQAPQSPFPTAGGGLSTKVEFNCSGTLLFASEVRHLNDNTVTGVSSYRVALDGDLTLVPGSPHITAGTGSGSLVLSVDEKYLFVNGGPSNSIYSFSVAANGSLSAVQGSPFPNPEPFSSYDLAMNRDGTLLYVLDIGFIDRIAVYTVESDGTLTLGPLFQIGGIPPSFAAYPSRVCTPAVSYDMCVQDDTNGNLLRISTATGNYVFSNCRKGWSVSGHGSVTDRGCKIEFNAVDPENTVTALLNVCTNVGNASLKIKSQGRTYSVVDRNITNNMCSCP